MGQLSDPVLRALVDFEEVMRGELDRERQRAEAAEVNLAETRRALAAVEADLALAVSASRRIEERISKDLGQYLEDNLRAQRGLIAITRQLLQSMGHGQTVPAAKPQKPSVPVLVRPHPSPSVVPSEPTAPPPDASPGVRPADSSAQSRPGSGAPGPSMPASYEWHAGVDPITDEHRIIDQSNRADMERLNSPSRRFAASTAFKRKNLLAGA